MARHRMCSSFIFTIGEWYRLFPDSTQQGSRAPQGYRKQSVLVGGAGHQLTGGAAGSHLDLVIYSDLPWFLVSDGTLFSLNPAGL